MENCIACGNPLIHTQGRRKKKYCNENCRVKHWLKTHPKKAIGHDPFKGQPTFTKETELTGTKIFLGTKPKNLEELKSLCPPELTGLDRSQWIASKRQEWKI